MWNDFEKDIEILKNPPLNFIEGMKRAELRKNAMALHQRDRFSAKNRGEVIKYILSNIEIGICPEDFFQDIFDYDARIIGNDIRPMEREAHEKTFINQFEKANNHLYFTGYPDYSHTSPYWQNVISLGLPGLKKRAENKDGDFYKGIVLAYEGAEIFLKRLIKLTRKENTERMNFVADALDSLTKNAPKNIYEALLLMYLFFFLQSDVECTYLRSFGSVDMLLYPLYKHDIETGTFTKEQVHVLVKYFIQKLDSRKVWANQPFALGGTDGQGPVNELSYIFLEEFIKLKPVYTKVHIRYSKALPEDFMLKICQSIKENGNAFVFINNDIASKALEKNGQDKKDTVDYGIVGCYEVYSQGKELPCSGNGTINMLKAVEAVIFNGKDALTGEQVFGEKEIPETFAQFKNAVKDYLLFFIDSTISLINRHEAGYKKTQFTPFISSTYDSCIEKGLDIYHGGAKYNSTSINLIGTANIADSLYSIKRLVYDEKRISLDELREILSKNWQGYEELRRYVLSFPKYGNNVDEVDLFAREITDFSLKNINGRENGHGGVYRGGTWSIDLRMTYGEKTGASADGRLAKEPLSKNVCAYNACDRNGATAHIHSATKLDYTLVPNGTVLDLSLSHTQVSGSEGARVLKATVDTFMSRDGFAIQYNVLNPETLKCAQRSPEEYKTLQVRLCGWNVLFNDLTKKEQDEFILQSESIC